MFFNFFVFVFYLCVCVCVYARSRHNNFSQRQKKTTQKLKTEGNKAIKNDLTVVRFNWLRLVSVGVCYINFFGNGLNEKRNNRI